MFKEIIKQGFEKYEIPATQEAIEKMHAFYLLLEEENRKMNLTGITGEEENAKRNFLDSCNSHAFNYLKDRKSMIDVGSGAGFPGIPLAILLPGVRFTLLESRQKRADFLSMCVDKLALSNVEVAAMRAEDAARSPLRASFEAAAARAVAHTSVLCEYLLPFLKVRGIALFYKGQSASEEIKASKKAAALLGGGEFSIKNYSIFDDNDHFHLLTLVKIRSTPTQYPRKSGIPSKYPLITSKPKQF